MENKYKVGDLITDKVNLYKIVSFINDEYQLKIISGHRQGVVAPAKQEIVEKVAVLYDLNNPLTEVVNAGVCYCEYCGEKLVKGDSCVRYDDNVYCDEECLIQDLDIEESNIEVSDLDDSSTKTVPMFELTQEQLDMINGEQPKEAQ